MTTNLLTSPRALFARSTLANGDETKSLSLQVDEAIFAIDALASSHGDLEGERERLLQNITCLQREIDGLTQKNGEYVRKLTETHEVITDLSQQAGRWKEQLTFANARAKSAEELVEEQRGELERLMAAIYSKKCNRTAGQIVPPSIKLVGVQ